MLKFLQKFHFSFCLLEALLRTLPLGVGTTLYALRDTPCHLSVPIWSDMIWLDKPKAFHLRRLLQISILFSEIKVTLSNPFSPFLSLSPTLLKYIYLRARSMSLSPSLTHTRSHTHALSRTPTHECGRTHAFSLSLSKYFSQQPQKDAFLRWSPKDECFKKATSTQKGFSSPRIWVSLWSWLRAEVGDSAVLVSV